MDSPAPAASGVKAAVARILTLDRLRGLAMVLMAIDHVRVYAGVPAGGPTPGVFLTRWITHSCAPAFFYLLHIPLIHGLALVVSWLREGAVQPWLFANHPMMAPPVPEGFAWPLWLLYLVWAVAVALLWLPCRWFAAVKERRREPWLSYL